MAADKGLWAAQWISYLGKRSHTRFSSKFKVPEFSLKYQLMKKPKSGSKAKTGIAAGKMVENWTIIIKPKCLVKKY